MLEFFVRESLSVITTAKPVIASLSAFWKLKSGYPSFSSKGLSHNMSGGLEAITTFLQTHSVWCGLSLPVQWDARTVPKASLP